MAADQPAKPSTFGGGESLEEQVSFWGPRASRALIASGASCGATSRELQQRKRARLAEQKSRAADLEQRLKAGEAAKSARQGESRASKRRKKLKRAQSTPAPAAETTAEATLPDASTDLSSFLHTGLGALLTEAEGRFPGLDAAAAARGLLDHWNPSSKETAISKAPGKGKTSSSAKGKGTKAKGKSSGTRSTAVGHFNPSGLGELEDINQLGVAHALRVAKEAKSKQQRGKQ